MRADDPCPAGCGHPVTAHEEFFGCGALGTAPGCGCTFGESDHEMALIADAVDAATRIRHERGRRRPRGRRRDILDLFAGPGGWDEGARILGVADQVLGVELDPGACAVARAAGHARHRADVHTQDPRHPKYRHVRKLVVSSPCPTFSRSGKLTGLGEDYQKALDAVTCLGVNCDCDYRTLPGRVTDPRTALVAETARWGLHLPNADLVVAEQVPGVAYLWEDLAAEFLAQGWEDADVFTVHAGGAGVVARRERTFLLASRYQPLATTLAARPDMPARAFAAPTMAQALRWPVGHMVRTRGNRDPRSGGNLFSADGPSLCLTGSSRSWERDADGLQLTAAEAGMLQGFRRDYPWAGDLPKPLSRTAQFKRVADVVCPPVAAAVLGYALGLDWEPALVAYLRELYRPPLRSEQLQLPGFPDVSAAA